MRLKLLTTCDNPEQEIYQLTKKKLVEYGYEHDCVVKPFTFGGQMPTIYEWCKANVDACDYVLYFDCYDCVPLAHKDEVIKKIPKNILFFGSGEKAIFPPVPELTPDKYPTPRHNTEWGYICAGNFIVQPKFFIKMYEERYTQGDNDQLWLAYAFIHYHNEGFNVDIDYNCTIMQSCAFEGSREFAITRDKRLLNRVTNQLPCWAHFNGRTDGQWLYSQLMQ